MSTISTLGPGAALPQTIISRRLLLRVLTTAAIGLVLYVLFFYRLADRDLWSSHEARAAMDAQTVLDSDWRLPHLFDGRAEMQKPPLYYWLVALLAWPRGGVDAWAVRLPAALSALGCVLFLGVLATHHGSRFRGIAAGLVLATSVHFPWLARIGRIDMPLTLTTTLAIGCFHLAASASRRRAAALQSVGYLAAAAGVMLKGPIGLILPAAVIVVHQLLEWFLARRASQPALAVSKQSALGIWWGLPLVAALTLPWFLWANANTNGEFFQEFFWRHNVERGLGNGDLRSHPWWLYLPYFANDFLPWTPVLLVAVYSCLRAGWWRTDRAMRLGLVWFVVVVAGLSFASFKRGDYLLPAFPGAALFLGCVLDRWRQSAAGRLSWLATGVPVLLAVLVTGVCVGWLDKVCRTLPAIESYRNYETFAGVIRQRAPAPREIIFFRTEAHALAFHVGRPLQTLSQWPELDALVPRFEGCYIVMPFESLKEARKVQPNISWQAVTSNVALAGGDHERPLVLVRAQRVANR